MPVSNYVNIPQVMRITKELTKQPDVHINSVLDIGCGFGKFGFMFRELLDVRLKRYNRDEWLVRLDTVEIYEKYITPMHKHLYDNIVIGDIVKEVDRLPNYDIIMMSEVLEHIPKGDGFCLVNKLINKTKYILFLSFPPDCKLHDPGWDNKHEAHISQWNLEILKEINPKFENINRSLFMLRK